MAHHPLWGNKSCLRVLNLYRMILGVIGTVEIRPENGSSSWKLYFVDLRVYRYAL